jgi:hypothetical protein
MTTPNDSSSTPPREGNRRKRKKSTKGSLFDLVNVVFYCKA